MRHPEPGGTVCKLHGGALPGVKRAAAFRLQRDKAQAEALTRLKARGAGKVETITEMDRLAAEVITFKDIVRGELDRIWALGELRYEGKTGEQLRAEVALYERALDRCNTVLATNVKLGIAEKKHELDKLQAVVLVGVIQAILKELNLSRVQQQIAAQVVPVKLREISAEVMS